MKLLQIGIPALAFFLLWLILSGHFDPFHITVGVISTVLVVFGLRQLAKVAPGRPGHDVWSIDYGSIAWRRAVLYPFIFLLNIIKANLQVAALILDPKLRIDPIFLCFRVSYKSDAAKIFLGNTITLTPGTVTLDIRGQEFVVHALSPSLAGSLLDGSEQARIAKVFGESFDAEQTILVTRKLGELNQ